MPLNQTTNRVETHYVRPSYLENMGSSPRSQQHTNNNFSSAQQKHAAMLNSYRSSSAVAATSPHRSPPVSARRSASPPYGSPTSTGNGSFQSRFINCGKSPNNNGPTAGAASLDRSVSTTTQHHHDPSFTTLEDLLKDSATKARMQAQHARDETSRYEVVNLNLEKRLAVTNTRLKVLELENVKLKAKVNEVLGNEKRVKATTNAQEALQNQVFAMQLEIEELRRKHNEELEEKDHRIEQLKKMLSYSTMFGDDEVSHEEEETDEDENGDGAIGGFDNGDNGPDPLDSTANGEENNKRSASTGSLKAKKVIEEDGEEGGGNYSRSGSATKMKRVVSLGDTLNSAQEDALTPIHTDDSKMMASTDVVLTPSLGRRSSRLGMKRVGTAKRLSSLRRPRDELAILQAEDEHALTELFVMIRTKYEDVRSALVEAGGAEKKVSEDGTESSQVRSDLLKTPSAEGGDTPSVSIAKSPSSGAAGTNPPTPLIISPKDGPINNTSGSTSPSSSSKKK